MAAPNPRLEAFVGSCVPPGFREEVLGDLREQYQSPRQYLLLFAGLIPSLVLRAARRRIDVPLLAMEALVVYLCYLTAAWYADRGFLLGEYGPLRIAIPVVYVILVLAYSEIAFAPATSSLRLFARTAVAALVGFLAVTRTACGDDTICLARTVPDWTDLYGSAATLIALSAIHIFFRRPNLGTPGKG